MNHIALCDGHEPGARQLIESIGRSRVVPEELRLPLSEGGACIQNDLVDIGRQDEAGLKSSIEVVDQRSANFGPS